MAEHMTQTESVPNKERLMLVVRALREDPDPENFTMWKFSKCRTPACALGHYASRRDL